MKLVIDCPHCNAEVSVPANMQTPCPHCGRPVIAENPRRPSLFQRAFRSIRFTHVCTITVFVLIWVWIASVFFGRVESSPRQSSYYSASARPAVETSPWDGSVSEAKSFVRKSVRDPNSVKYNSWKNYEAGSRHITTADITATNGFGGPVRQTWVFSFDKQTGALMTVLVGGKTVFDKEP